MRILIVGSGGREHALCRAVAVSPLCDLLYCAPGNAGIAEDAECVDIAADDIASLVEFAVDSRIGLVIVGPEAPLVAGLADALDDVGIACFGPSRAAAQLEASKSFVKQLCDDHDIPTAKWQRFEEPQAALDYIAGHPLPLVVKADGLAAGKGVTIARTKDEAQAAIHEALVDGRFGAAGASVVVEEFLDGEECSFFCLVDGETVLPLASAQDHKAAFDGDTGPNTGGMGACSPAYVMTKALEDEVLETIIHPTARAMARAGMPFRGVLFAGLMMVREGARLVPKLLEYNVRFGDPEAQVIMTRLISDPVPALLACATGRLGEARLRWYEDEVALCVVLAAKGYPGNYRKGTEIRGVHLAEKDGDVTIFHSGTRRDGGGPLLANGGRVLCVTTRAPSVREARERAYEAISEIEWEDAQFRTDIGWRALEREEEVEGSGGAGGTV